MTDEKRMIMDYEVTSSIQIGNVEVIFAEDDKVTDTFLVCTASRLNPLGIEEYNNGVVGPDYLELMTEFLNRASGLVKEIEEHRAENGIPNEPLTAADCIEGSRITHYENQIIVIKPENMTSACRTADRQLLLATHGNGCNPNARGTGVFCKNLFTGDSVRWERYDVAGIIRPDRLPDWAKERLAALYKDGKKPSILGQLADAKKEAETQDKPTTTQKKKSHEL